MRNEKEMLGMILQFAKADERIRSVILNGSRVNPDVPKDIFQDYDIVFLVSSVEDFVRDRSWINYFGELIIMQTPDEHGVLEPDLTEKFAFLMLFSDGNRIDLTFFAANKLANFEHDSLSQVLLDKDGMVGELPPPSNNDYLPVPPTEKQFSHCCNEFWWVSTYIAKGLWRHELSYARFMFERPVRDMLMLMIKWHIGIRSNYSVDPGKLGKYFKHHLSPKHWERFVKTFPNADYENIWNALFVMCDLFREIATDVSSYFD